MDGEDSRRWLPPSWSTRVEVEGGARPPPSVAELLHLLVSARPLQEAECQEAACQAAELPRLTEKLNCRRRRQLQTSETQGREIIGSNTVLALSRGEKNPDAYDVADNAH